MTLFKNEPIISHAGLSLLFKIECDALTDEDIETLASIISRAHKFKEVHGIPRGGIRLANALQKYLSEEGKVLIVDDLFTTGKSMEGAKSKIGGDPLGVVIFARGACPQWIFPIFQLGQWASL